jgi:hypothetical protein
VIGIWVNFIDGVAETVNRADARGVAKKLPTADPSAESIPNSSILISQSQSVPGVIIIGTRIGFGCDVKPPDGNSKCDREAVGQLCQRQTPPESLRFNDR